MHRHQLHLMDSTRAYYIERHDFYVAQVKARVLSGFTNFEEEADQAANAEYDRLMSLPYRDDIDAGDLADQATQHGQSFYSLLRDLHEQTLLGALSGCFHQWDKQLRGFLDNELRYTTHQDERRSVVWHSDMNAILGLLEWFGWDVRASSVFPFLDAGRLIVNVFKHGNGRSLTELSDKYRQYIHDPIPEFNSEFLDHDWVKVSESEFDEIAAKGVRQFWSDFPEIMYAS